MCWKICLSPCEQYGATEVVCWQFLKGSSDTVRTAFPSSTSAGSVGWPRTRDAGVQRVHSAQLLAILAARREQVLRKEATFLSGKKKQSSLCLSFILALPSLDMRELSRYTGKLKGLKRFSVADQRRGCFDVMQSFSNVDRGTWPKNKICPFLVFLPPKQVLLLLAAQYVT